MTFEAWLVGQYGPRTNREFTDTDMRSAWIAGASSAAKQAPGMIATRVIEKSHEKGLDCVSPNAWGNATEAIHSAVFFCAKDALNDLQE